MTLEMGKPLAESRGRGDGTPRSSCAGSARRPCASRGATPTSPDGATRLLTLKRPVGPTLMITPWNFPLAMGTRKVGPAVAAGCTMVVKPAAQTALSMCALGRLMPRPGSPTAC